MNTQAPSPAAIIAFVSSLRPGHYASWHCTSDGRLTLCEAGRGVGYEVSGRFDTVEELLEARPKITEELLEELRLYDYESAVLEHLAEEESQARSKRPARQGLVGPAAEILHRPLAA